MTAETMTDLHELLAQRQSPRSFDPGHEMDDATLVSLLEAARWAPSSMNAQPWRFVAARRGTPLHAPVMAALMPGNQLWAGDASLLVVAIAERERDGKPLLTADYDLGLAVAQLTMQAHSAGLHAHQMGGFDGAALRATLELSSSMTPVVVVAIGVRDEPHRLPDHLRVRETAPRSRRPLHEVVLTVDGEPFRMLSDSAA